jgi:glutathione S-transferase
MRVRARPAGRLEIEPIDTKPIQSSPEINRQNPLGKVPVLVRDDGTTLYDSVVICEYFDSLCPGAGLFPEKGEARWQALRLHALADGLSDAAITVRRESRRLAGLQWADWAEAHARKLEQTYDLMAGDADVLSSSVTIGHVALATALEWIAFRKVGPDFRQGRSRLADWYDTFARRPSMSVLPPTDCYSTFRSAGISRAEGIFRF